GEGGVAFDVVVGIEPPGWDDLEETGRDEPVTGHRTHQHPVGFEEDGFVHEGIMADYRGLFKLVNVFSCGIVLPASVL
ncbi:MAG: hypothetical protein GX577_13855, partial [Leptolinea sp.]|nr:hypothetical protein [Leptolinea sp.]